MTFCCFFCFLLQASRLARFLHVHLFFASFASYCYWLRCGCVSLCFKYFVSKLSKQPKLAGEGTNCTNRYETKCTRSRSPFTSWHYLMQKGSLLPCSHFVFRAARGTSNLAWHSMHLALCQWNEEVPLTLKPDWAHHSTPLRFKLSHWVYLDFTSHRCRPLNDMLTLRVDASTHVWLLHISHDHHLENGRRLDVRSCLSRGMAKHCSPGHGRHQEDMRKTSCKLGSVLTRLRAEVSMQHHTTSANIPRLRLVSKDKISKHQNNDIDI